MMAGQQWTTDEIREECERKAVAERAEYCKDDSQGEQEPGAEAGRFDSAFVLKCLFQNQVGDAEIFRELHRGRFLYDHAAGQWYQWAGHYWEKDKTESVVAAMQAVCRVYEIELQRVSWRANKAHLGKPNE